MFLRRALIYRGHCKHIKLNENCISLLCSLNHISSENILFFHHDGINLKGCVYFHRFESMASSIRTKHLMYAALKVHNVPPQGNHIAPGKKRNQLKQIIARSLFTFSRVLLRARKFRRFKMNLKLNHSYFNSYFKLKTESL